MRNLNTVGEFFLSISRYVFLATIDFGPDSVDGWLAKLAATELGVHTEDLLDAESHELLLEDERVPLSPLEFGVLQRLLARNGKAVSRATLIEEVWGHTYVGGSNVVDVVVGSLRKKLGQKAASIETVCGVGYRFSREPPGM